MIARATLNVSTLMITFILIVGYIQNGNTKNCDFPPTNQTLELCEISNWLPWNCSCVSSLKTGLTLPAFRLSGICCAEALKANTSECHLACNATLADVREEADCETQCLQGTTAIPENSGATGTVLFPGCVDTLTTVMTTVSDGETDQLIGSQFLNQTSRCSFGFWDVIITDPITNVSVCVVMRLSVTLLVLVTVYASLITTFLVYVYKKGNFPSLVPIKATITAAAARAKKAFSVMWSSLRGRCNRAKTLPENCT